MNSRCIECPRRMKLLDYDFRLACATTAANVHANANVRMMIIGALDFVRADSGKCERCENAIEKAEKLTK